MNTFALNKSLISIAEEKIKYATIEDCTPSSLKIALKTIGATDVSFKHIHSEDILAYEALFKYKDKYFVGVINTWDGDLDLSIDNRDYKSTWVCSKCNARTKMLNGANFPKPDVCGCGHTDFK